MLSTKDLYFIPILPQEYAYYHLKLRPEGKDLSLTSLWVTHRKKLQISEQVIAWGEDWYLGLRGRQHWTHVLAPYFLVMWPWISSLLNLTNQAGILKWNILNPQTCQEIPVTLCLYLYQNTYNYSYHILGKPLLFFWASLFISVTWRSSTGYSLKSSFTLIFCVKNKPGVSQANCSP